MLKCTDLMLHPPWEVVNTALAKLAKPTQCIALDDANKKTQGFCAANPVLPSLEV